MKKLLATLCLLPVSVALGIALVFAQSAPNWPTGYNPTTAEINAAFAQKLDASGGTFTGAVNATTLTVSGLISGAGVTSLFASPPAMGSFVPAQGFFTTLSATSTVSGAGFTALFAAPPPIGLVTPNSGSFTTMAVNGKSLTLGGNLTTSGSNNLTFTTTGTTNITLPTSGTMITVVPNYLTGVTLSDDVSAPTTTIDTAAGSVSDSTNAQTITIGAFTKTTASAWASGTGNPGMGNSLTVAINTWYHVCLAYNGGTADEWFDTSVTCTNKPTGISGTLYRRIGSFKTDGSAHILVFNQTGDRFDWGAPVAELSGSVPGVTTAVTQTLAGVPLGVITEAILEGSISDTTNNNSAIYISSLGQTDLAANTASAITAITTGTAAATTITAFSGLRVVTNASQQVRRRVSSTALAINLQTAGWMDTRGK